MRRILIVATVVALTLAMGMGGVVAQEEGDGDGVQPGEQGPVSPDDRDDDGDQEENETEARGDQEASDEAMSPDDEFTQAIDNQTTITDWEYRPGMFVITIESEKAKKLSMTEAGDFERGTGSFNYKETTLQEGTNRITMPVTDRPGAGVAIATRASLDQGTGAFVSVGQLQRNPFKHFGGEMGLFTGVIMTTGIAALSAAYVIRSEDSGVIEA